MFQVFYGVVSSTGPSPLVVSWDGTVGNAHVQAQEFSAAPGATWSVSSSASASSPFPALTAYHQGQLYYGIGFAWGNAAAGGTTGVSYDVVDSSFMAAWDTGPQGTLSPDGSGAGSVAVLLSATAPYQAPAPSTPLLWAGQYRDPATGLYYMRARWYDPATGQFLSVDPLVAQTGLPYSYAGDNPVNEGDPSGLLSPFPPWRQRCLATV